MPSQTTDALLRDLFETAGALPLSFEMFPPRSAQGREALMETVGRLADAATDGFSVTMGAGGSTRGGTHEAAVAIREATGRPVTAHLTALGLTREAALETAERLWADGVTRILALRGDRPRDSEGPPPPGFAHAADLVAALRARHDFAIAVAAYPEKHPEAGSLDEDIEHLKEKLDAGAGRAICQFVLNPEAYGRFLDACARHGVDAPITPGLMPLENWSRIRGFARQNGAGVPDWLDRLMAQAEAEPEIESLVALAATLEQARRLIAYGAPALHVYALNRWRLPLALARLLGHQPGTDALPFSLE
jgi:methylenetetrahydrofolate reductase (NADPH)